MSSSPAPQLIYDLDYAALTDLLVGLGQPRFRADQIWLGIYQKYWNDPAQFVGLPNAMRNSLPDVLRLSSLKVAREMAEGALVASDTHLAVSVTGIAGPGGSEFKPEGRVCFGLAIQGRPTFTETVEFGALGRERVRTAARGKSGFSSVVEANTT